MKRHLIALAAALASCIAGMAAAVEGSNLLADFGGAPGAPAPPWRQEQRDVHADFLKLFGDESSTVPPLLSVAVSADSDNSHRHTLALLSDLVLR